MYIQFEMVNKKEDSERRDVSKPIRFTEKEVEDIDKAAKFLGLDFSNFVRLASKEKVIKTKNIK